MSGYKVFTDQDKESNSELYFFIGKRDSLFISIGDRSDLREQSFINISKEDVEEIICDLTKLLSEME